MKMEFYSDRVPICRSSTIRSYSSLYPRRDSRLESMKIIIYLGSKEHYAVSTSVIAKLVI